MPRVRVDGRCHRSLVNLVYPSGQCFADGDQVCRRAGCATRDHVALRTVKEANDRRVFAKALFEPRSCGSEQIGAVQLSLRRHHCRVDIHEEREGVGSPTAPHAEERDIPVDRPQSRTAFDLPIVLRLIMEPCCFAEVRVPGNPGPKSRQDYLAAAITHEHGRRPIAEERSVNVPREDVQGGLGRAAGIDDRQFDSPNNSRLEQRAQGLVESFLRRTQRVVDLRTQVVARPLMGMRRRDTSRSSGRTAPVVLPGFPDVKCAATVWCRALGIAKRSVETSASPRPDWSSK